MREPDVLFLFIEPQRQVDEGQHEEGQRGVHPQVDGGGDAGDAQRVPSCGDEGIEVAAGDALSDFEEHEERARHHGDVDREGKPLAEHIRKEGANGVYQRVVERRMGGVDDLVPHHLRVVKAVFGRDGEVLVHVLRGVPAADAELFGGVREVVGEQLVLVVALLDREEEHAHAEADKDDQCENHPRFCVTELHNQRPFRYYCDISDYSIPL